MSARGFKGHTPILLRSFSPLLAWYACDACNAALASCIAVSEKDAAMLLGLGGGWGGAELWAGRLFKG